MDDNVVPPADTPDAPDAEKMDQIRRRRLEKLAGSGSSSPKAKTSSPETAAATSADQAGPSTKPNINTTKTPTPPAIKESPVSKIAAKQTSGNSGVVVRTDSTTKSLKRVAEAGPQNTPRSAPRKPTAASNDETIEDYENRTLGELFRITLDPNRMRDAGNHKLIFLPNLRQELEDEKAPMRLTKDTLDSAILEAASSIPQHKSVLDYLLPCWKRITKALKGLRGYANAKDIILKEAKRLCMSNCIFAAEVPELFGREPNSATDLLTPHLLLDVGDERGLCIDFLNELYSRVDEDDSIKQMITKTVIDISSKLSGMTMNDEYKPYVNAMKIISAYPKYVAAITEDSSFQMAVSAPEIEMLTILGPFFRISPLQPQVTKVYFSGPATMDQRHIRNSQESLRLTLQTHQRDLLDIINRFIRAADISKNRTLDWFAYIVNSNHKRRAMRPDPATLSSDGFLMNVTVILDGLCEPFMDAQFSKVDRIDVNYLRRRPRVDIKDETKLNADEKSSDEFYSVELDGNSNFISEVFFLTLAAHHYGSEATNGMMKTLDKDIKYMKEKIAQMEVERPKFAHSPINMARFEEQLRRFNEVLDKSMCLKLAIEGVLLDKNMQAKSLTFMRYVTVWLLRIATNSDYKPEKSLSLPLPDEQPETFKFLPEYVLEDIVGNFNFIFRFMPDVMRSALGEEVNVLCITFLTNSDYIKNPYLKAKLVSMLFHGTWPIPMRAKGILGDSLTGTKFANDHLLHALMKFYIEVESTGAHTQFYDKFNIRYEIFYVIKCIWSNTVYRDRLTQESKSNTDFFLRFVNLLLNDATYVLDEALTKFPKIHDLQVELKDPRSNLTAEQRQAKEEELSAAEGQASSYMQLTNETISMMKLFTKTLSGSFTMPEIVDRVAAMVNYTLDTIVGPKSSNLKVDDPKKYQFEPKTLLSEFIDIYLNLGVSENFISAVARDGRSYKPANFDSASRVAERYSLKSADQMKTWEQLKARFKAAKELDDQDEEDYEDAPDEYLDPLLATLMTDPVILPMSKQVVDRSTIRSHLLSDPHDPFNRQPMKIEDVVEDTELKNKINEWRLEMKQKAKTAKENATKMDTTEG